MRSSVIAGTDQADAAAAGTVVAVHAAAEHAFSKSTIPRIDLVAGRGVRGDAHFGPLVRHRSRVARAPEKVNLRQIHLLQEELLVELRRAGWDIPPGGLGENVTTRGLDLLGLSAGTQLKLGARAVVELTGLRNPCTQIERYRPGLLAAVCRREADGRIIRRAGVMGIVVQGGTVRPGDPITIVALPERPAPLEPV